MSRLRRRLVLAGLGGLITAGVYVQAGAYAHAEPTVADQVCTIFEEHGVTQATAAGLIAAVSNALGISPTLAAETINASVESECPELWPQLVHVGNQFRAEDTPPPAPPQRPQLQYAV